MLLELGRLPESSSSLKPIHIFAPGPFVFDGVQHAHSISIRRDNAETLWSVANEKRSFYT